MPSKNRAAVIAFPGRNGPQQPARLLARHGYGVLLFDRRGEGDSEGDPNSLGWDGEKDLDAALAFLRSADPTSTRTASAASGSRSAARCCSKTAAETDDLKAVVSEGAGIRSVREGDELPGPRTGPALRSGRQRPSGWPSSEPEPAAQPERPGRRGSRRAPSS